MLLHALFFLCFYIVEEEQILVHVISKCYGQH